MLKTCEPQGQTCIGPSARRSEPNFSGSLCLKKGSLGRRNRTVSTAPSCPLGAPCSFIRLTAHIVYDIKIKGVNTDDGHILVYYDMWDVDHKNNLSMFGGQSNSVKSATVTIDWSEYLVLVRQKKLNQLGI